MPDSPAPAPGPTQPKQMPGRRKAGANAAGSANRKNYASENDAAGAVPDFRPDYAHRQKNNSSNNNNGSGGGGPTTPRKAPKNAVPAKSPAVSSTQHIASGKANRRNGTKNMPKNIPASPAAAKKQSGRRTPPQATGPKPSGVASSAPAADQAFAGASFHASPAPSALPLPSFFTKANSPGTPRARPESGLRQQPSPPASDSELPSATATTGTVPKAGAPFASNRNPLFQTSGMSIPPPRDESPLDLFFRADREEKARNRRASSANIHGTPTAHFSPPMQTQPLPDNANSYTFPRDGSQQQNQQQTARRPGPNLRSSSSGISAAELDGTPGQPIGPAFATPFQERIRAARPTDALSRGISGTPTSPGQVGALNGVRDLGPGPQAAQFDGASHGSPQQSATQNLNDRSAALKRFLFSKTGATTSSGPAASPGSAPTTPSRYPGNPGYFGQYGNPNMGSNMTPQSAAYGGSPYHNVYSPSSASGTPNRPFYPGQQALGTPNSLPGSGNGGVGSGQGNRTDGSTNVAAMEDSLRQILKLDSPFGGGAGSPGYSHQR